MSDVLRPFGIISGAAVHRALAGRERQVVDLVEATYRLHGDGGTVVPPSRFLRFPARPAARIIALPASIGGERRAAGIKWVSSFPDNVVTGLPRASAVLVLNDLDTGYPYACLEGSIISAARTAASATVAARWLSSTRIRPARLGFVGVGLIARYIDTYLAASGWSFDKVGVYDLSPTHAHGFRDYLRGSGTSGRVVVHDSPEQLIRDSDLVVFATTTVEPHVHDPAWFGHRPLVLHISLRDLAPRVVLDCANIVDDVEHCLTANTSVHLTEQQVGHRHFLDGTLHDVLSGSLAPDPTRPLVFSPFGLGALDVAVGCFVYDRAREADDVTVVDDFFFELSRYGAADAGSGNAHHP